MKFKVLFVFLFTFRGCVLLEIFSIDNDYDIDNPIILYNHFTAVLLIFY